ncbi:MAG: dihydrofolate reductase family protein, partial [Thermoplasmata archaeon]
DSAKTIIFVGKGYKPNFQLPENVLIYESSYSNGKINLECVLHTLYDIGIRKILVEGGSNIIYSFLNSHFVDELIIYIGSIIIGGDAPSLVPSVIPSQTESIGAKTLEETIKLNLISAQPLGNGILVKYKPAKINML